MIPVLKPKDTSSFTYQDLLDLNNPAKSCKSPLSIICHIDINAYFAQYEQLRLGLTAEDPVVCLQWFSLIAVSYAARKYGISRMDTMQSAKLKCPNLIVAHTAVFKKGEDTWKYVDYLPSPTNHKVSLDPYRRESRKMMRIFKRFCDCVEKASVDECFMDFGRLVIQKLQSMFPDLFKGLEDGTITRNDHLPPIPNRLPDDCGLEWNGYVVPKVSTSKVQAQTQSQSQSQEEEKDERIEDPPEVEDWDDLITLIGSQLGFELRETLMQEMGYTTSLGIGRVKTIAKLASGFKKPDNQTIVCPKSIDNFLTNFKLTDFWSMGGKIGEAILYRLDIPSHSSQGAEVDEIGYIRDNYSFSQLTALLSDYDPQVAERLYLLVRGELHAGLELRTLVKSMGSNKNFKGEPLEKASDIYQWFRVFLADLSQRFVEMDEENEGLPYVMRPTKLTIHCGNVTKTLSKQLTMGLVKDLTELKEKSFELAKKLLVEFEKSWDVDRYGKFYPCSYCGLSYSNLKEMDSGFSRIDELMSKIEKKPKAEGYLSDSANREPKKDQSLAKKRKPDIIDSFNFTKKLKKDTDDTENAEFETKKEDISASSPDFVCPKCRQLIAKVNQSEHEDYHFALSLSEEFDDHSSPSYGEQILNSRNRVSLPSSGTAQSIPSFGAIKKSKKGGKIEKGQSRLPF